MAGENSCISFSRSLKIFSQDSWLYICIRRANMIYIGYELKKIKWFMIHEFNGMASFIQGYGPKKRRVVFNGGSYNPDPCVVVITFPSGVIVFRKNQRISRCTGNFIFLILVGIPKLFDRFFIFLFNDWPFFTQLTLPVNPGI